LLKGSGGQVGVFYSVALVEPGGPGGELTHVAELDGLAEVEERLKPVREVDHRLFPPVVSLLFFYVFFDRFLRAHLETK
jgi:hypothetical protein